MEKLILASSSPRRAELLNETGLIFSIVTADADENIKADSPKELVKKLAVKKALSSAELIEKGEYIILGADTVVALNGKVLGKPHTEEEAVSFLKELSGKTHSVFTSVAIIEKKDNENIVKKEITEETKVTFFNLTEEEIKAYVKTGEAMDKAGAYAIQGRSKTFIESIEGDYYNVVGFPIGPVYRYLRENYKLPYKLKKKAFVFDLDGTLSDTVESIAYCTNRSLEFYGFKTHKTEDYFYFAGDGADNLIKRALKAQDALTEENFKKVREKYGEIFAVDKLYKVRPFTGMVDTLKLLKKEGYKLAVLSNKPDREAKAVISAIFGDDIFHMVFGAREGFKLKPDPNGVFEIARELKVDPDKIVYVGDTDTDMKTGKASGAHTVGVLWGFRGINELIENGADIVITKPVQLQYSVNNNFNED